MNRIQINQIINRYPLIIPRLYVFIRSLILPIGQIERYLPVNKKILDVGCGYGFTSIFFALMSSKRQITGIELKTNRVSVAKKAAIGIPNVKFAVENLISKQHRNFDVIVAIDLLHHLTFSQKSQFLLQCYQLLPVGGDLLIKDINTRPRLKYYWNYFHTFLMTHGSTLEFMEAKDITKLLQINGFIVKQNFPLKNLFYPHYLYVCQKK